jgi:hypothetical protein
MSEDVVTSEGLSRQFDRLSMHENQLGNAQDSASEDEEEDEVPTDLSEEGEGVNFGLRPQGGGG